MIIRQVLSTIGVSVTSSLCARAGRALMALLLALAGPMASAQIQFTDATSTAGFQGLVTTSYGASWGDINGDGWPDLFANNHARKSSIFLNQADGTFLDVVGLVDGSGFLTGSGTWDDTHGGSWADMDNDGDEDLLVTTGNCCEPQFFLNENGILYYRSAEYGFGGPVGDLDKGGRMPVWFDRDDDGWLEVALMSFYRSPLLAQSSGTYVDVLPGSGFVCSGNQFASLVDLNGDGRQELICVTKGGVWGPVYDTSTTPFQDVTGWLPTLYSVNDIVPGDYDGNLRNDLFILRQSLRPSEVALFDHNRIEAHLTASAGGTNFSFQTAGVVDVVLDWNRTWVGFANIFIGQAGGHPLAETFTLDPADSAVWGVLDCTADGTPKICLGYDPATQVWQVHWQTGDKWIDSYFEINSTQGISNLQYAGLSALDLPRKPHLLTNLPTGIQDITAGSGLNENLSCVSGAAADFDNDMDLDLYLVCRGGAQNLVNRLYENQGDGSFVEVAGAGGAAGVTGASVGDQAGASDSVVVADYDVDGRVDLFVANGLNMRPEASRNGGPYQMFQNSGPVGQWVELDLVGTTTNRDAIGARVYATAGGKTQYREQNGGYHRWSQNHKRIHFGLAGNSQVDLTVEWPSGATDTFTSVAAGELYRITEGAGIEVVTLGGPPSSSDECGEPAYSKASEAHVFLWKDCNGSQRWHLRATAGGSPSLITYAGEVVADQAFTGVTPFSLETSDVLDYTTDPQRIDYMLQMANAGEDGFDFTVPAGATACFDASILPAGAQVFLGLGRVAVTPPFDLGTLGTCSLPSVLTLSAAPVSVDEVGGSVDFTVSLSAPGTGTVTVDVATMDGTATAGTNDYVAVPLTTLSFAPGETSKPVTVTILDDALAEGDETFELVLSNPSGATLPESQATATIVDNEVSPCDEPVYDASVDAGVFVWKDCATGAWQARMTAGGGNVTYVGDVAANQAFSSVTPYSVESSDVLDFTTDPMRISYSLTMGAQWDDGFDFTYPPGASACFGVDAPAGAIVYVGAARAVVSVPFDLDTLGACTGLPPTLSAAPVSVDEVGGSVDFTVSLSAPGTGTVTVDVATMDGTATAGTNDYVAVPLTTLSFAPGETSKPVTVTILDDALAEGDETFELVLSNPSGATLPESQATATIVDNEVSPCDEPVYDASVDAGVFVWKDCATGAWQARMTAGGGNVTYVGDVAANQAFSSVTPYSVESSDVLDFTTDPMRISYSLTMGAQWDDGFDFTYPPGASACFGVDAPAGAIVYVGAARAVVSVPFDLDTLGACTGLPPTLSAAPVSVDEVGGSVDFTVSLSAPGTGTVTVDVATMDGTATAGTNDYVAVPLTTLSFAPGETSKPVTVTILDDALAEGDETFELVLSNPSGATLPESQATATIVDNEVSPCGGPAYSKGSEAHVFLWKDCDGSERWHLRATGGGSPTLLTYIGDLTAGQAFLDVTGVSLEASDILDYTTDPQRIDYTLKMVNAGEDGFDFTLAPGAAACFDVSTLPAGAQVLVGQARITVTPPFDLQSLGSCSSTVPVDGTIAVTDPSSPGDVLTVSVTDADLDVTAGADTVVASVVNDVTGESESLILTETGATTGVFSATLATIFGTGAGTNDDGTLVTLAGDTLTASYTDSPDAGGGSTLRSAVGTVVVGGP